MNSTCRAVVCVVLLAGAGSAQENTSENKLPDAVLKALERADEVTVYSLNGETGDRAGWHGAKVLGKTAVTDGDARKALATAVGKGVAEGTAGTRCFIPRHGLTVKYDGTTYDLLICFECRWLYVYTDGGDKPRVFLTSEAAQKALDKILTDADVELAK
jgi:hypothetical protein